jgi:phosphate transport system protein
MITEIRSQMQAELDRIRADVIRLAAIASECIPRGTEILLSMDLVGAQTLIEDDDIADALSIAIEARCDHVLAVHHPVAGDLREVMTALRLASDLERSIDLMVSVVKRTRRVYPAELPPRLRGLIERLSEESAGLLRLAIDSYVARDPGLAAAIDDIAVRLRELGHHFMQAVFDAHDDGEGLAMPVCVQLALIGRFYERIGEHALDIAERVRFMATGWRHETQSADRLQFRRTHEIARLDGALVVPPPGSVAREDLLDRGSTIFDGNGPRGTSA